ncbi:MAG: hypothetical protein IJW32_04835 [Clostridia bacterium]|nr:hypothetical protein [Clostridia bacterium]
MTEEKKQVSPQGVYEEYLKSIHDHRTYVMKVPSKNLIVFTNNRTMFTTFVASEYLRRDEAVREGGESASYSVELFTNLHVATQRKGYAKQQQDYSCALLYKETPVGAERAEYHTLIMTNSPELQEELFPEVMDGHCCTFNLSPHVGNPAKEIDSLSVEGCYGSSELTPIVADSKGSMMSMQAAFENGEMYDWIHDESYRNVAASTVKNDITLVPLVFDPNS